MEQEAAAEKIEAYLWLTGEPDVTELNQLGVLQDNEWLKIGVITITFIPDITDLEKTPRN